MDIRSPNNITDLFELTITRNTYPFRYKSLNFFERLISYKLNDLKSISYGCVYFWIIRLVFIDVRDNGVHINYIPFLYLPQSQYKYDLYDPLLFRSLWRMCLWSLLEKIFSISFITLQSLVFIVSLIKILIA